jgi:nucleotide-binding universal stress UspA family protein
MSYKTILVHLNDEHRLPGLLAAAIGIAKSESAHLVGLSVLPPIIIIPGIEGDGGTVIDDHREAYRGAMVRMHSAFAAAVQKDPGLSHEWVELDCENENPLGIAGTVAVKAARCADLVIAARDNPSWSLSGHLDLAEPLVLESGRPVLVIPGTSSSQAVPKRIVVAWNGRREAARAAFDALPFLQKAEAVNVVWIDHERDNIDAKDRAGMDLCAALARHGVRCEASTRPSSRGDAGAALLATVDALDADLLVMGCYGHSRLREMILGGASRHVLQHARVPVLMSH